MRTLEFRHKEAKEQPEETEPVRELKFERKKKAPEPVNTTPGYPREETVEGTYGQPLLIKHINAGRFEVWQDDEHINTFVNPDLLPDDDPAFGRKQ